MSEGKIKVMIIDDSALVRMTLGELISDQKDMEVIAMANDPYIAVSKIKDQVPDVITLDIEMPRMDGLTFLKKIMSQHPIPVVIVSSLAEKGSRHAYKALQNGAIGVFNKDDFRVVANDKERLAELLEIIRSAKKANLKRTHAVQLVPSVPEVKPIISNNDQRVIVIGASTGGTVAVKQVLQAMPADSPGIVIVQHLPKSFTGLFAEELDKSCAIKVKEAKNCEPITPGKALIAPGDKHVVINSRGNELITCLSNREKVNNHRPSVDVLFKSAALHLGKNVTGVLLTGMGKDGAVGLKMIKDMGGYTIAQDESTSIVYGMPREAALLGAADKILPLDRIAKAIFA